MRRKGRNSEYHCSNGSNKKVLRAILAHHQNFPRLAVLIGRMPVSGEVETLELAQSRDLRVRIITYDEILEAQKHLSSYRANQN